ncbi:MAG: glutathione S-transferase [Pelagimonas sp.]
MKLLQSPASPFVRKVRVTLHETGQWDDVEQIDVTTSPQASDAALTAANPLGKIPALIRPDGPALYDSRVICRFLDARANGGFYPDSHIWDTLALEATADGIMEAALAMVYETRYRDAEQVSQDWIEAQWAKVARALDAVNSRWMSHLQGRLDMGHIAIGAALGYLDLRHEARNWRGGRDGLAQWYTEFAQRPSMQATQPPAA